MVLNGLNMRLCRNVLYFLTDKQASDYFTALGYEPRKEESRYRLPGFLTVGQAVWGKRFK